MGVSDQSETTMNLFVVLLLVVFPVVNCQDCWWTGCQKNDWAVRGCKQYNRTETQNRACDNGLEYYCCVGVPTTTTTPASAASCWWTGCQKSDWAVRGCDQYNRTQSNIRACSGGSEYYCCEKPVTPAPKPCWWTGCQADTWAVTGCKQYNMSQSDSRSCTGGKEYYCCPGKQPTGEVECWWSGCQPKNWTIRGCPTDMQEVGTQSCGTEDGDMFECCSEKKQEEDEQFELSTGETFINFVKFLLLKGKNFTIEPDNLPCLALDVDKESIFKIQNQGIYTCDLCPHFPHKRFVNVFLSNIPSEIVSNVVFPECFGLCFDRSSCVAISYDHLEHTCYIYNNTVGTFIEEERWTTVMMTQPVGVLDNWTYSRHTSISGEILQSSKEPNFLNCLSKCNSNSGCNYVSYSIRTSNCSMFASQEKIRYIDLKYADIAAFKITTMPVGSDSISRFLEDGDDLFTTETTSLNNNKQCSSLKNATHSGFYSQACLTSGALGCDSTTGCKLCYYPEKTNQYSNLAICPDSEWIVLEDFKESVQRSTQECLESATCVGVGYNSHNKELHQLTLSNFAVNTYTTKFILKYPIGKASDQALVTRYNFLFNYDIVRLSSNAASFQETTGKTLKDCLNTFGSNSAYIRMSYFNGKCKISSEEVKFVFQNGDYVTAFKKPDLTSPLLHYARTPGFVVPKSRNKASFNQCGKNCEVQCAQKCNSEYKSWCSHFTIEHDATAGTCYFFEVLRDSVASSIDLQRADNGQIFTKLSSVDFTLDSLNKINPFQSSDIFTCFRPEAEEQSQTSLSAFDTTNQNTGVTLRRKRGFFDFLKKAFKAVGDFVVDTVKDIVKPIVDTAKGVVETVKNVVKGDFKKAKESFVNIPIVKDVKNVVDLGKAVVTGDWDTAKERGIDLLQSSTLDIATSVIPGGKIVGKGLKTIGKSLKKTTSNVKNTAKKKIDNVNDNNRKVNDKNSKDNNNNNNKDEVDLERNQCKRRTKRATNPKKRKRPADCDSDDEDDDDLCPVVNIAESIAKSMKGCRNRKVNADCEYECNPGYDEPERSVKCIKRGTQKPGWTPIPNCDRISCGAGVYPLIPLTTPHVSTFGNLEFGRILTAFVVLYDKWRKLPIWSIALHQSNQFNSEDYTALKELKRASAFKPFPCPELNRYQASPDDYKYSGWDQGHLTPANVARWSEKAKLSSNLFINVAPQDPYTNQVPWSNLEGHVECFSKKRRSLVATGICSNSIDKTKSKLDVPACYWKMICYKDEQNKEQVVGFITDNTHVSGDAAKKSRRAQVFTPVSQRQVKTLLQSLHLKMRSPWLHSATEINRGRPIKLGADATVWFPVNPFDCEKADDLSDEEKDAWVASLNKNDKSKTKRATGSALQRGCTSKAELENMKSLLGVYADGDDEEGGNSVPEAGGSTLVSVQNCNKRIIGYYTSWGEKEISGRELRRLTHVVYAFLEMHADGTVEVGSADRKNSANINDEVNKAKRRLENLMQIATYHPHVKIMFAVGGWENSQYFSAVAASPDMRIKFIASVVKMIQQYGFDGVDIDWEYPVTGGANEGIPQDKQNYVLLMKEIRTALDNLASERGRKDKFLLSFAGAAGQWTLDPGFDLPGLLKYADFVNIMTYDYFGAWSSKWGAYTGPPAPLFFGMPPRFSGKTNTDWTVKYYTCKSKLPHKINMGVPFYGRYWKNVGPPVDGKDGMWRTASRVNGIFEGGYVPYNKIQSDYLSNGGFQQVFHEKSKTPYAWNAGTSTFLGYENPQSLKFKVDYAVDKNVGGLMIWAVELDDDDLTMLDTVSNAPLCTKTNPKEINHKCSPIDEKRWWTSEDGDDVAGLCGRSAPLYKGYYPVCDPDDPGYSCCGPAGYCGTGEKYCSCPTCKDYLKNPEKILENPIKPTVPVTWYFLNDAEGKRGRCGRKIPKIKDVFPTCNPDDGNAHCCSNGGYCGNTEAYCKCNGCVDFKANPSYRYGPKKWWDQSDGKDKEGKCGPTAPKVDGIYVAECEPNTKFSCCSASGYCGSGAEFCDCAKCKKF